MLFFCKVPATLGAHLLNAYNWLSSRAPQIQSLLRRLHMASFYIHGAAAPARCRAKRAHTAERLSFVTVTMCAPHHAGIYYDASNRIARVRYISTRPLSDETAPYQTLGVFILLQLLISGAIERDACSSVILFMPARDLSLSPQLGPRVELSLQASTDRRGLPSTSALRELSSSCSRRRRRYPRARFIHPWDVLLCRSVAAATTLCSGTVVPVDEGTPQRQREWSSTEIAAPAEVKKCTLCLDDRSQPTATERCRRLPSETPAMSCHSCSLVRSQNIWIYFLHIHQASYGHSSKLRRRLYFYPLC